jgi:DNA polymerase III subunit gamma/tau
MSLYKKYRPKTWDEVRGNQETVSSIENLLKEPEKCNHSFLMTGQTGCGKTTIARIMASYLKIEDEDLQEINSSDFRGIDTIREIIKNSGYKPMKSKYRMFLLDEVHQLSKDAQNAILKILEDTPKHVFFILCTTDPQKLLPTIKNRCINFEVQPLQDRDMRILLKDIATKENDTLDKEVLMQIVKTAQGRAREGVNILEQVLNVKPELRLETAKKAQILENQAIDLCRALIGGKDWNEVKEILNGLKDQEAEGIRRVVLGYTQAILLKSANNKAAQIMEEFLEPTYNSGFAQIVYASYSVING